MIAALIFVFVFFYLVAGFSIATAVMLGEAHMGTENKSVLNSLFFRAAIWPWLSMQIIGGFLVGRLKGRLK